VNTLSRNTTDDLNQELKARKLIGKFKIFSIINSYNKYSKKFFSLDLILIWDISDQKCHLMFMFCLSFMEEQEECGRGTLTFCSQTLTRMSNFTT